MQVADRKNEGRREAESFPPAVSSLNVLRLAELVATYSPTS
jgi:hypothetical protein